MAKKTTKKSTTVKPVVTTEAKSAKRPRLISQAHFSFRRLVWLLVSAGIILFISSGYVWWHSIVVNPDRAMSGMLEKSLDTADVTRAITQQSAQEGDLNQVVRLSFAPSPATQTVTTVSQPGSDGQTSKVVTESIGTPTADYVRYRSVNVPGQKADFSNIVNVWGRRDGNATAGQGASFLNDAALGIVPMGKLNASDKKQILQIMHDKGTFTRYNSVKRETKDGRPVYVYKVSVNLADLVQALAAYSKATGLGDASQLDPAAYISAAPLNLELTVDILSRHLTMLSYTDSGRTENYEAYGQRTAIDVPSQTISLDELQKRIQSASQTQ